MRRPMLFASTSRARCCCNPSLSRTLPLRSERSSAPACLALRFLRLARLQPSAECCEPVMCTQWTMSLPSLVLQDEVICSWRDKPDRRAIILPRRIRVMSKTAAALLCRTPSPSSLSPLCPPFYARFRPFNQSHPGEREGWWSCLFLGFG